MSTSDVMDLFKALLAAKNAKKAVQADQSSSTPSPGATGVASEGASPGAKPSFMARLAERKGDTAAAAAFAGAEAAERRETQQAAKPSVCELPSVPVTAGCTSVVALLLGHRLIVANAGDSRAVLCRAGAAVALSEDHKPSQEGELRRIEAVGGFVNSNGRVNGNLNLSRSIGDLKYKQAKHAPPKDQMITAEPDVLTMDVDPTQDEFMILACDGIWDCFSNDECVDFVRRRLSKGMLPAEIAKEACDTCLAEDPRKTQGIGGDNMTFLLVVFDDFKPRGSGL